MCIRDSSRPERSSVDAISVCSGIVPGLEFGDDVVCKVSVCVRAGVCDIMSLVVIVKKYLIRMYRYNLSISTDRITVTSPQKFQSQK